jgi:antitoxin MazE
MSSTTKKLARKTSRKGANGQAPATSVRNSTVSKWGNSLGVRIPQEAAERLRLGPGSPVTLEVGAESITIRPAHPRKRWTMEKLLDGVTPEKVGGEFAWGPPVGREKL